MDSKLFNTVNYINNAEKEQRKKKAKKTNWFSRLWIVRKVKWEVRSLVVSFFDVKNFLSFRKEMEMLKADPKSKFNQLGLNINKLGNIVYFAFVIDQARDKYTPEQKNVYLKNMTMPQHDYISMELNWGEYMITEFHDFYDEEGHLSRYHGVTFTFEPLAINNWKIWWNLIWMLFLAFVMIKGIVLLLIANAPFLTEAGGTLIHFIGSIL